MNLLNNRKAHVPMILILDQSQVHKSAICKRLYQHLSIIPVFIPAGFTKYVQPDDQHVFGSKQHLHKIYYEKLVIFMYQHLKLELDQNYNIRQLKELSQGDHLLIVLQSIQQYISTTITSKMVSNAWKATGLQSTTREELRSLVINKNNKKEEVKFDPDYNIIITPLIENNLLVAGQLGYDMLLNENEEEAMKTPVSAEEKNQISK